MLKPDRIKIFEFQSDLEVNAADLKVLRTQERELDMWSVSRADDVRYLFLVSW